MSWRKFSTLVKGLSPQSATVNHIQSEQYLGQKGEKANLVEGAENVDRAIESMFGKPERRTKKKPKPNK
jgi:hypothetical protein